MAFNWLSPGKRRDAMNRDLAADHIRQGNALLAAGKQEEALAQYQAALAADDANVGACINIGFVLSNLGRNEAARQYLERALRMDPHQADGHYLIGLIAETNGEVDLAEDHFTRALASKPDFVEARLALCRVHFQAGRVEMAKKSAEEGLLAAPQSADLLHYLGNVHLHQKNCQAALACYDTALEISPELAEACNNRGLALQQLQRYDEALASFDRAVALDPEMPDALNNRGNALLGLGRLNEALESYRQALVLQPDNPEHHNNFGWALHEANRLSEAMASYEVALRLKPDYAEAHWNQSLTRLLMGDFEQGWRQYEWRWQRREIKGLVRAYQGDLWLGNFDLRGRSILLHAEQGLGDTIQFCRYAERVSALGARVMLEVQPPLLTGLAGLKGVDVLVKQGEPLPDHDCHCPLLSLPLALQIREQDISGAAYLGACVDKVDAWRKRLGPRLRPRVGIVWSGSLGHKNDRNRSLSLADFSRLLLKDVDYFCLQKEIRPSDAAIRPHHPEIQYVNEFLHDFADTAALIELMDLVISVDTSVAHLAGALGKPVWILLPQVPDWRWLQGRHDSPWYGSARLFRQAVPGDWTSVLGEVRERVRGQFALPA